MASSADDHCTLHRSDLRSVRTDSQSDVRSAQLGRGTVPQHTGGLLRAGCHATHHSAESEPQMKAEEESLDRERQCANATETNMNAEVLE